MKASLPSRGSGRGTCGFSGRTAGFPLLVSLGSFGSSVLLAQLDQSPNILVTNNCSACRIAAQIEASTACVFPRRGKRNANHVARHFPAVFHDLSRKKMPRESCFREIYIAATDRIRTPFFSLAPEEPRGSNSLETVDSGWLIEAIKLSQLQYGMGKACRERARARMCVSACAYGTPGRKTYTSHLFSAGSAL